MITDVVKRSFTKWLSGSKANAELPYPPKKKERKRFFEGVLNFPARGYHTNFRF